MHHKYLLYYYDTHCTRIQYVTDGCPNGCSKHGECRHFSDGWKCTCHTGWTGKGCDVAMEMVCDDMEDNDRGKILIRKH